MDAAENAVTDMTENAETDAAETAMTAGEETATTAGGETGTTGAAAEANRPARPRLRLQDRRGRPLRTADVTNYDSAAGGTCPYPRKYQIHLYNCRSLPGP